MEIPGQKDHLTGIASGASLVVLEVVVVTTCSQFILNQFTLKRSTSNLFTMCSRFISNRFIHIHTTVWAVQPVEEVILAHSHTVRVQLPVPATAVVMGEHVNCMDL
jgi:hypothetical protein